jgi:hypothetical protein
VLDGVSHLAVAWQDHDWDAAGYHLYDVLSVAEDGSNLAVTFLYCRGDALPYAYTESFLHPMDYEPTSGTCAGAARASSAAVSLPALSALPAHYDPGVRIDGEDVSWDGASGRVRLAGVDRALHPFGFVDCTDCPGGPWLEVHGLLDGPDDACFGILYLFPDDPSFVQLSYTLCLPGLERPEASLEADWYASGEAARPPGVQIGPGLGRPPGLSRPPPERVRPEEAG